MHTTLPTHPLTTPSFKAMLLSIIALLFVATPLATQLPINVMVIFATFWLIRVVLLYVHIYTLKMWQLIAMLISVGLLVFSQLGTIVGLEGGTSFLLLLALLKSYEGKHRRDWHILVVAMLFLLATAVLFNQELFTGLWVLLCLPIMATALALLNEINLKTACKNSLIAFLLTVLPTIVLFITMPRRDTPLWGMPQATTAQSTTGMSETMKPGSIGNLVQSNEPAFSASFANGYTPRKQDLYWRVMIYGQHDGNQWNMMRGYPDNVAPAPNAPTVAYNIIIEDDKGRIPALDYPAHLRRRGISREAGDVLRVYSRQGVRRISLEAHVSDELPHILNKQEIQYYTRLPANQNPRTHALAQQLLEQSNGDVRAFIQRAYAYFAEQKFVYTLQPPVLTSTDTTDQFLFNSKQGFCEHYADAFVTLMRAGGVPARVVGGYQGGEYNEGGDYWQIRSKDAHAWAEVWLADQQIWKRIDPTASVSIHRIDGGIDQALPTSETETLLKNTDALSKILDRSRFYWQQWIVNYDSDRQQNLFSLLGFERVNPMTILMVLLLGAIPALLPLVWWWRRSRQQDIRPLEHGFMLLKRRLLGANYPNLASIAPQELRKILLDHQRLSPDLTKLLDDYIDLQYAQAEPVPSSKARAWYRQARRLAKKHQLKK